MSECSSTVSGQATVMVSHTTSIEEPAVTDPRGRSVAITEDISNVAAMARLVSIKWRRTAELTRRREFIQLITHSSSLMLPLPRNDLFGRTYNLFQPANAKPNT